MSLNLSIIALFSLFFIPFIPRSSVVVSKARMIVNTKEMVELIDASFEDNHFVASSKYFRHVTILSHSVHSADENSISKSISNKVAAIAGLR